MAKTIRGFAKKLMSVGKYGLLTGPIWVPVVQGASAAGVFGGAGGGVAGNNLVHETVFELIGYNIPGQTLDQNKLKAVVARDAAMIAGGLVLGWVQKKV